MVKRTFIIVMAACVLTALSAGLGFWFGAQYNRSMAEGPTPTRSDKERAEAQRKDFFKSTAPPTSGGQDMRPRWD